MLKKFVAVVMGVAMLANAGMISYADEFTADESVSTDAGDISTSVEAVLETTNEEKTTSAEEVGSALRKSLKVRVCDIVYFGDTMYLYDPGENIVQANPGDNIYIVGIDDENQRFRVIAEESDYFGTLYLKYEDAKDAELYTFFISNEGFVVGDLDFDGVVDVFDMCLMRRGYIYGWDSGLKEILADMNDDGEVTVADLVWLQKWLLGVIK